MSYRRFIIPAVATAAFLSCTPSMASLVTVTGGFTSYSGPVGSGVFETTINGVPVCPDTGCGATVGAASLNFNPPVSSVDFRVSESGAPETPNLIAFAPATPQDVALGQEFLLGTFTYTNGDWFGDTDSLFGFTLTSVSSDPLFNGHSFVDTLKLGVTSGRQPTPEQSADFISFVGRPDLGSLRAYELFDSPTGSNTVTAEFYGRIGSLIPTRFANPSGGGFLDSGVDLTPTPTSVPEPGTLGLFGSAFIALALVVRRRAPQARRSHDIDSIVITA